MSSSSSPTRTSRTNPNGARAAKQNERHAQPPARSPENASRQPRTARPAAKKQRSPSDPHRAGRSSAGNVSSNANSRVLAVSESNSSSRLLEGHVLRVAFFFRSDAPHPQPSDRRLISDSCCAITLPTCPHPLTPRYWRHLLSASACGKSKGQSQAPQQAGPPPAGVSILTLGAEGHPRDVGVHRVRALSSIDDRKARRRRHRHENPREGGRPRARGNAARPDRPGAPTGRRAQRGGQPGRHRSGRPVLAWTGQAARSRSSPRERSAVRNSSRRRTRCALAEARLVALEAQVREGRVQLGYYRVEAGQAGTVGDIAVRDGDRVTNSTVITTIDDNSGLEAVHPGADGSLARSASSACRFNSSIRQRRGRGDQPHHLRRAPRGRRDADGAREERAQTAAAVGSRAAVHSLRASSGGR